VRFASRHWGVGGRVVEAFDGIAHAEDECRVFGGGLLPDLLPDARLRLAGAVAQQDEVERGWRGVLRQRR
jgi:hypothetical protein